MARKNRLIFEYVCSECGEEFITDAMEKKINCPYCGEKINRKACKKDDDGTIKLDIQDIPPWEKAMAVFEAFIDCIRR